MDQNTRRSELVLREEEPAGSRWEALDPREFLSILSRRRWVVLGTVVIITGLAALFAFFWTPQYTANLQLVFDAQQQSVIDFGAAISGQPQDEAALLSEIEVIKSRALAGRVIDKLGLLNDPEFNANLAPPSIFAKFAKFLGSDTAEPERDRVIDAVIECTQVLQSGRSRAVEIDFTSTDPVKAAVIGNTLGDLFLVERLEGKFENAQRASKWLAEHVQELREQVEVTQTKAENYRREHNLLQGERVTLLAEQISTLNTQLSDIRRARTEAKPISPRRNGCYPHRTSWIPRRRCWNLTLFSGFAKSNPR